MSNQQTSEHVTDENENKTRFRLWVPQIPQLYHDIIARLLPGAVMICTFVLTTAGPKQSWKAFEFWLNTPSLRYPPTTVIIGLGLVLSYILGVILWGIWFKIYRYIKKKRINKKRKNRKNTDFATGITFEYDNFNIIYELIKWERPTVGHRITKLKGQIYMSHVLIVGFVLSLLINLVLIVWTWSNSFDSLRIILAIFLLVAIVGSEGARRHFVRHTKAEVESSIQLLLNYEKCKKKIMTSLKEDELNGEHNEK